MKAPESLATKRLLLRKPRAEDAPLIFAAYAQDPDVTRYLTFRPHGHVNEALDAVNRFLESWRSGESYCWLLFRCDGEELVGAISAREDQGINLVFGRAPVLGTGLHD